MAFKTLADKAWKPNEKFRKDGYFLGRELAELKG